MTSRRDAADLPPSPVQWAFADSWAEEPPALAAVRSRAQADPAALPSRSVGAALRLIARLVDASHVIEWGSSWGISAGWLLEGMQPEGTLTSIDADPTAQARSRATLADLGIDHSRVRIITGHPAEVLPRLTDGAYDLIVVPLAGAADADVRPSPREVLDQAQRLLRPGGALVALSASEDDVRADHGLAAHLRDDDEWTAALLTVGAGMVVAHWNGAGGTEES